MKIDLFQDRYPKESGYYLFRHAYTNGISLVKVTICPNTTGGGGTYLGDALAHNENIENYIGFFTEKLKFHHECW